MLYKLILPNADRAFVQSERMKQEIVAKGVSADRIVAVPMGVSPDLLSMRPCESPTGMEHPAVVYLGSMLRVRRLEMIIKAFSVVLERVPKARLYMIGGEHQADIEFLCGVARRLGVAERVTFTGNLPRAEALSMTRAADVCLSPIFPTAIFDVASPTKLVEYMALGKPVVGSQQPEQQQVLSESGAGLVAPFDAAAFATATAELLLDPLRAKAMGAAGREWVRNNRLYPCIAARLERAYDAVVSCSAPPAGEPETGRRL
jgi:glycosyltransferase involved in cell wall biosynthesis